MSISIGVQTIMPKTGTSPQTMTTQQSDRRDASTAPAQSKQAAPPPPGMGKFVDKHV